jgi:NTP pyrophosphatase (non-canonical NTP hydrolase)
MNMIDEILKEVIRAESKFPGWPTDPLHAAMILAEECGEAVKAVNQAVYEPLKGGEDEIRAEVIQTAAMCLRFLKSLDAGRYEFAPCRQHQYGGAR